MIYHHGDMHQGIEASDDLGMVSVLVKGVIMLVITKTGQDYSRKAFLLNYSDEHFPENL